MILKILLVALLLYVIYNLFQGLFHLMRQKQDGPRMSHFIGRRVLFSVIIIALIVLALATGILTPNPRPY
ncbi:DUF2909 domain-containing protein [Aliidiomarina sedimenti]|uniref:DUF2909 domain-containing protein n=2 Tax=Aliidiomarina TaxID=1249554 RepID=A0A432WK04_9GAMM|nr:MULTISPECIES: DUF2909 domain-containing protein [Aliidiomarina]RUO30987.1 DUF2909 domain-containing protein [Aliidiomarina sedimenti]RUO34123.1 DUF2909 domain-containing protein [Aliidiomarina soli]